MPWGISNRLAALFYSCFKEYVSLDYYFFRRSKAIDNEVRISQTKCASCFGVFFLSEQRANLILGQITAGSEGQGRTSIPTVLETAIVGNEGHSRVVL